jgi:hypothetical protein
MTSPMEESVPSGKSGNCKLYDLTYFKQSQYQVVKVCKARADHLDPAQLQGADKVPVLSLSSGNCELGRAILHQSQLL